MAFCLKRHEKADVEKELSQSFRDMDLSHVDFRFILVVKNHEEQWLVPLQEALNQKFWATAKTWALAPSCVLVLNNEMAAKKGLVS
jgi:hypothetical protein